MSVDAAQPGPAVPTSKVSGNFRTGLEILGNILLSLIFLNFALQNGQVFLETLKLSTFLLLVKVSTDVVFYLIRRVPREVSISVYDWFIALAGTYAIGMLRSQASGSDALVGQILQQAGIALQVAAMLSLNRSIGMVPANRGIKTGGLYRWVRHPLYMSYILAFGGFVLSHPTLHNISVYFIAVCLWLLRLFAEERFLLQSAEYRDYAQRVRWRVIPYVF